MLDQFSRKEQPVRDLGVLGPGGPDSIWPCGIVFIITEGGVRGFGELSEATVLVSCKGGRGRQNWRSSVYMG